MIIKTIKLTFLMVLSLVVAAMPAMAAQEAPILPKAKTSTMLDVARVGQRMVAVGERGHVLYSDDESASWTQAKVPFRRMLTALVFLNDRKGIAVGHESTILVTEDGGETWAVMLDGMAFKRKDNKAAIGRAEEALVESEDALAAIEAQIDAQGSSDDLDLELEEAEFALEDAEFALEDAQFAADEAPIPTPLMDVFFVDEQRGWAVGAFGLILQTQDGGKNWENISDRLGNSEGFHLNAITGSSDGKLFAAAEAGVVFRSVDAGATWDLLETGFPGSLFGATYNSAAGSVMVFGMESAIFSSADNGDNWTPRPLPIPAKLNFTGAFTTRAGKTVIVGLGGLVLVTTNDGERFGIFPQKDRKSLSGVAETWEGNFVVAGQGGPKIAVVSR